MFRTYYVHHQEDYIVHLLVMSCLSVRSTTSQTACMTLLKPWRFPHNKSRDTFLCYSFLGHKETAKSFVHRDQKGSNPLITLLYSFCSFQLSVHILFPSPHNAT